VLVLGGGAAAGLSPPIALALAALMIAVGLGELPGLAAAAGLMTDYGSPCLFSGAW
jgi:hypothetical protein